MVSRVVRWWFQDPSTGEIVLWQAPNAPLVVAEIAAVVHLAGVIPDRHQVLPRIRSAALVVWSIDEVLRGTTPYRRALGAVTLAWQTRRVLGALRNRT